MKLPSRLEVEKAKKTLENSGWNHVCTVLADKSTQCEGYGLLYTKENQEFWLNKDTIGSLPN